MAPLPPSCCCCCCSSSFSRSRRLLTTPTPPPALFFFLSKPRRRRPPPPPRLISSSCSSSSSYNGWSDLAAAPDLPLFPLPLQPTTHRHGLLLFLLPAAAAALALFRLPPLPLLAAAFTAGFAARHLSSPPPQSNSALLAHLDAQLRALRGHLLSEADPGLLVQAVDRLRDAVADAARLAAQGDTTRAVSDALPPVLGALGEVGDCLGAWARHAVRDLSLSSPRRRQPTKTNNADVSKANQPAAAAAASPQPQPQNPSVAANIASGMLQFDEDDSGLKAKLGDAGLERLVFKHRHGRDRVQDDPFQAASSRFSTESSLLERTLEIRDRSYRFKIERRDTGSQVNEAQDRAADEHLVDNAAALDPAYDGSAAADSDSEEFSRNVKEAAQILRKVRESMVAMADEETADALLYKSARLLSTAVALRPTSLVAVGQLGNTYLLHGELKLKISRELRTLLANSGAFLNGRERVSRSRKVDSRILSRESISSALVDVCEECESLLVEAGRSYRTALSIDSGDVKALYNWGLALIFRAQLLADIGPEAAVDADQVYLAAIDKFDAMLSRSNTYAPEALYRWGTTLQQRSHLRPRNNREKIRLLEQAKSLFEDVLYVEADNKMVREALSSCISELNYHGRWL
ncbi:hypothetical protein C2845_PM10G22280 [Panicum miliaceum]|uniref:Uncharacterized protein n=1 Tax=Panicum miliaceum TaxID=4540 RepID=A0A3L6PBH9_PANMI|nr:hypothetical protein C2845_PM10G22280 [Panicum miliaceum]